LVSKQKVRYNLDGFDLDLTCKIIYKFNLRYNRTYNSFWVSSWKCWISI